MEYLFLSALVLLTLCTGFHSAYCRHGIEACYLGLYKGIVEEAVVVASERDGDYRPSPKIYLPRLGSLCRDYFQQNLTPYCRSYTFALIPRDTNVYPALYTSKVTIVFTAKISDLESVEKTAQFSIWRTNNE